MMYNSSVVTTIKYNSSVVTTIKYNSSVVTTIKYDSSVVTSDSFPRFVVYNHIITHKKLLHLIFLKSKEIYSIHFILFSA